MSSQSTRRPANGQPASPAIATLVVCPYSRITLAQDVGADDSTTASAFARLLPSISASGRRGVELDQMRLSVWCVRR